MDANTSFWAEILKWLQSEAAARGAADGHVLQRVSPVFLQGLFRYAVKRIRDDEKAHDVFIDALLAVVDSPTARAVVQYPEALVRKIVNNRITDYLRKVVRQRKKLPTVPFNTESVPEASALPTLDSLTQQEDESLAELLRNDLPRLIYDRGVPDFICGDLFSHLKRRNKKQRAYNAFLQLAERNRNTVEVAQSLKANPKTIGTWRNCSRLEFRDEILLIKTYLRLTSGQISHIGLITPPRGKPAKTADTMLLARIDIWTDFRIIADWFFRSQVDLQCRYRKNYGPKAVGLMKVSFIPTELDEWGLNCLEETLMRRVAVRIGTKLLPVDADLIARGKLRGIEGIDNYQDGNVIRGHHPGDENCPSPFLATYKEKVCSEIYADSGMRLSGNFHFDRMHIPHWAPLRVPATDSEARQALGILDGYFEETNRVVYDEWCTISVGQGRKKIRVYGLITQPNQVVEVMKNLRKEVKDSKERSTPKR